MTAAERIANSTSVTVAARIAMFLTPLLLTIALFILGNYLASQAQAMQNFAIRVEAVERASSSVATRVTTIEANQTNGRAERIQQQSDLRDQVKELQAATNKRLDKVDDTLLALSKAVSALDATLRAMGK